MSDDGVTRYDRIAVRIRLASALKDPGFAGEETARQWIEVVGSILTYTQWPATSWEVKDVYPPRIADRIFGAKLGLQCEGVELDVDIFVIPAPNKQHSVRLLFGRTQAHGRVLDTPTNLTDPESLADVVDDAIDQIHKRFVEQAWKATGPKGA